MDQLCSGVFLLLVTASIWSPLDGNPLHVHLKPASSITVCEGVSVKLNCTWSLMDKNVKLSWHFDNNTADSKCNSLKKSEESSFIQESSDTWSLLTKSVRTNDSGWYFCKVTVDIPVLTEYCSNGLYILVEANNTQDLTPNQNQTTTNPPTVCSTSAETPSSTVFTIGNWWIWVAVAVGCIVLIMIVVAICLLSCKTKEAIYENTARQKSSCWRQDQSRKDACNLPASKKVETIKPLRKYDTLSENRYHRP